MRQIWLVYKENLTIKVFEQSIAKDYVDEAKLRRALQLMDDIAYK